MSLFSELRYSLRRLIKNPGSSLGAVLAMALGIGLTVSMFAVIDGAVLRGLPFEESERLLQLEQRDFNPSPSGTRVSEHDFVDWRSQQQSFEALAGFDPITVNLSDEYLPERYHGVRISASFLDLLRVKPFLGQGFRAEDERPGAPPVLLIGHHVWRQRYDSDPDIVGRVVRVNAEPSTVIGVLPPGFRFPFRHDVWLPLQLSPGETERGSGMRLGVFGRLADGVSIKQAAAEMETIGRRLEEQYPEANKGIGVAVKPYVDSFIDQRAQLLLGVMLAATLLVLLIASINVANLLIVRAASRGHELAIRSALGASRAQTLGQVLLDAGLLATGGVAVGVMLAHLAVGALSASIADMDPPFWVSFQIDGRVLFFTLGVTVLAALAAGLGPAWQASKPDLNRVLQDAARGSSSFRMGWLSRKLVIIQLAVSFPLLIGAGLMVRTVATINNYDLHLEPQQILTARLALFDAKYPEREDWQAFFEDLESRLAAKPGVSAAGIGTILPLDTTTSVSARYLVRGTAYDEASDMPVARFLRITPGYLKTLGVAVRHGRGVTASDRQAAPAVVLVSEALARQQWPGENAIGQRLRLWRGKNEPEDPDSGWAEVVGVAPNLHFGDFDNPGDAPAIYFPFDQYPKSEAWIVVRTAQEPMAFAETLRQTVREIDPNLPLFYLRPMQEVVSRAMFFPILLGTMFSIFGAAAVLLATIGLYGVIAFRVAQRTREMGVRMALGGTSRDVLTLVLRQSLMRASVGLLIGLALAVPLGFALRGALFRLQPMDPMTFGLTALLLLSVAAVACFIPAVRAASVDPIEALHQD